MAFSFKSSISFGLVYIPIRLHNVIKSNEVGFNMIDKKTNSRITYKKVSTATGEEVKSEDIVKGYQYEKDRYVIFDDTDFDKIKTKKDRSIIIESFVDISEIDPVYYDKAYYITPDGAEKAFALLKESMEEQGKIGIAKSVLGTKERVIALRMNRGEMILNTMHFYSEVQASPLKKTNIKTQEKELQLASMIINSMVQNFQPENYNDEYNLRLQQAVQEKIRGEEITVAEERDIPNAAVNLMEALQRTLNQTNKQAESGQ